MTFVQDFEWSYQALCQSKRPHRKRNDRSTFVAYISTFPFYQGWNCFFSCRFFANWRWKFSRMICSRNYHQWEMIRRLENFSSWKSLVAQNYLCAVYFFGMDSKTNFYKKFWEPGRKKIRRSSWRRKIFDIWIFDTTRDGIDKIPQNQGNRE